MIEIKYTDHNTIVKTFFDDKEEYLGTILLGFIKVCSFAGYYTESFDNLIKEAIAEDELSEKYHFEDFLTDYVYEKKHFCD